MTALATCILLACGASCQLAQDVREGRAPRVSGKLAACPTWHGKLAACPTWPGTLSATDPDGAVQSGRQALDHWWGYPWYDADSDGVRRVDVKEPYSWDWLGDWISDLFEGWDWSWVPFASGFSWPTTLLGWIAWTLIIALFLTLVWLLYRTYRRWAAQFDADADRSESSDDEEEDDAKRVESLPFPVQRRRGDLLEEARRNYRQGNYGEAIIYLFSYELVQLDKHHLIHLSKGKTNRQYLREVGRGAALGKLLHQTMVTFEDVFFGNHAIDRARCDRCWLKIDRFQSLVAEATA